MTTFRFGLAIGCGALALSIASAQAQEPIKIGVVSVLTGPAAALGQQVSDGFQLAVNKNGGKLGGVPVKITVIDDELKPDVAVERVRSFVESEKRPSGPISPDAGTTFGSFGRKATRPFVSGDPLPRSTCPFTS